LLPVTQDFQNKADLFDKLVNGRIEITEEVKDRVRDLFS
jgi:hypothetical protein